jgi:hypothetical protein
MYNARPHHKTRLTLPEVYALFFVTLSGFVLLSAELRKNTSILASRRMRHIRGITRVRGTVIHAQNGYVSRLIKA